MTPTDHPRRNTGQAFDPADCDRIPIHIPGHIQPHGALLVLRPDGLVVIQASANTDRWLGIPAPALLGMPLAEVLGPEVSNWLSVAVGPAARPDPGPRYALTLPARGDVPPLDVTAHRSDGLLVLELEASGRSDPAVGDPYTLVRDTVVRLQSSADVRTFCQTVADEVRQLTGFDRVMLYRFAPDSSGWVLAEARREDMVSYLDKRFPAGDVPRPARELMARNWLRLVPDLDYTPVPLVPMNNPVTGQPLDMSFCLLRHASQMCTTYLKNIGTACQMVLPLLTRDGTLWGLISCHHTKPRLVPFPIRAACEVLAQVASLQVAAAQDREAAGERHRLSAERERLLSDLDVDREPSAWLLRHIDELADHLPADGLAVRGGGQVVLRGRTPTEGEVRDLLRWLGEAHPDVVFASDRLAADYPPAACYTDRAAGVLAIDLGCGMASTVLWFRREEVTTVEWAGDPRKPVETGPLGEYLSPRRSFERWAETVRGKCAPWRPVEVEGAASLREGFLARVRSRAEQANRQRAELEANRREVDSFVYVASHDLKEPLRGIHGYAHFLIEQAGAKLDQEERKRLEGLMRLTDRMEGLIESLLHFSRAGRLDLDLGEVNLEEVAAEAVEVAGPRVKASGAEVILRPLPIVHGDRGWLREVFVNLITNAIKYNDRRQKVVEIGQAPGQPPTVYVRDNGIGIPENQREAVFTIFKRLHGRDEYGGGTGAGLAIVRKVIERHGGRIWLESTPGQGSTFYFTLTSTGAPR